MSTKFNPEVLPSMTLDELRDYQSPDRLRTRIAELEAALTNLVKFMDDSGFSTTTIGGKDPFKYGGFEYSVVSDARRALNPSIEGER